MQDDCPFCDPPPSRIVRANALALWIHDGYPVSPRHSLIIPRRHVTTFFETTAEDRSSLFSLLDRAHAEICRDTRPDGFNIGVNDGSAAGQTVPHLHIHLIPRRLGDVVDPRGGVRWVIPEKARYWST